MHLSFYSQSGLIGFYGPAVITQFGEHPNPDQYTVEHFFKAVEGKVGKVEPSKEWTDDKEFNWLNKEDLERKRKFKKNRGYEWLRKGKAKGKKIFEGGQFFQHFQTSPFPYVLESSAGQFLTMAFGRLLNNNARKKPR